MSTDPNKLYTDLRIKLDNMGMHQTLHPDSVQLVDRLLKELVKVSGHYQQLKRERTSTSSSQITDNPKQADYKFDLLNKHYHQVLEQNKLLKDELGLKSQNMDADADKRIKAIREKYDSKIAELTEKIVGYERSTQRTDNSKQELADRVDTLLEENHSLNLMNKKTEKMYVEALQQASALKEQLKAVYEGEQKNDQTKTVEIQGILQKKTTQLQESEQNNLILKAKINALNRDLEAAEAERRQCLLESKTVMGISETIKLENRQLEQAIGELKDELQHCQGEIDSLKKTKSALEAELFKLRERELTVQVETSASQQSKGRLEVMYQDVLKSLQAKKLQIDDLNHTIQLSSKQSTRQDEKIRQLNKKNLILNNSLNEMQTELDTLSSKLTATLKENRELESAKIILSKRLQELELVSNQQKELISRGARDETQQMAETALKSEAKSLKSMEAQARIYQEEISILKENEQSLVVKNEKLQSELKRMEVLMANGNRQMDLANTQKESLMKEIHSLKESLSSTQNSQHNSKTSLMSLQEKLNSSELLVQDLKTTLQAQCQKTKTLAQQTYSLQSAIKQNEQKSKALYNDNVQLRRLCESIEATKNELFEKLKLASSSSSDTAEQRLRLCQEHQMLRQALNRAEDELRRKQTAMITIDDERDQMQILLDQQTEENSQLKKRIEQLEGTLRMYNKDIDKSQMTLHQLQNHASNLQSENDILRKNLERANMELQSKEGNLMKLETNLGAKTGEIDLLVLSNKDLQRELERMRAAYNDIQRRFKDRTREHDGTREEVEVLRMENAEVSDQYREEIAERKRLEGHVQQLQAENHNMYEHLQQRDRQVAELSQHVLLCEQKENQYLSEIASYERQVGMLTNQLALREDELHRAFAEREAVRTEASRRKEPLELKAVFEERFQAAQNEAERWKRESELFRHQVRELEKVLEQERSNNFLMSRELQSRVQRNTERATPIKTLMGRSLIDSNAENSSLHANSIDRPEMRLQDSFESHSSINSRQLQERVQLIEQQYKSTLLRNKF